MLQYVFVGFFLIIAVFLLIFCLCHRRRKIIKNFYRNELLGVDGKVKIRNPDEIIIESTENRISDNTHRSLPEIPIVSPVSAGYNSSQWENNETNSGNDVTSELYATVAMRSNSDPPEQNSVEVVSSCLNNSINNNDTVSNLNVTQQNFQPLHCSNHEINESAAVIMSNSTEMNHDNIPYMGQSSNEHFSGDSQDSSKGYTSISVREPLADLLAQTIINNSNITKDENKHDYATVLDDDEMYAAIDESENISETYAQINLNVPYEINDPVENPLTNSSRNESASSSNVLAMNVYQKPETRQANSPLPLPPPPPPPMPLNLISEIQTPHCIATNVPHNHETVLDTKKISNEIIALKNQQLENIDSKNINEISSKAVTIIDKNAEDMYAKVIKNNIKKNAINNTIINIDQNDNECNSMNSECDPNYETVQNYPNYEIIKNCEPQYEKLKRKNSADSNSTESKND